MLADSGPQTLLLNEIATTSPLTSLSRRSTFDEDAFFSSPVKSKPEPQGPSGGLLGPQQTHMLPTVHDNVLKWFYGLISNRQLRTSISVGALGALTFLSSLVILQFSFWSPLRFFSDALSTVLAISTSIAAIGVAVFTFVICFAVLNLLTRAEQPARLQWTKTETWLGFGAILLYNLTYSAIIFTFLEYPSSGMPTFAFAFSTILSAFSSIFRNDFQLNFCGSVSQLGLIHTILGFFSFGRESILVSAFREAAHIVAITTATGCLIGFFSRGFSSILFLFNISFHIYCVVVITGQLFTIKVLLKMVRHIVMKPIYFPLPPSFLVHTPTPEQMRTLIVALGSEDALLKLFAFADLRRIAWTDRNRRLEVFSLSQPGGHPRNWSNVSTACMNILERIRDQLEIASTQIASGHGLDKATGNISEDDFDELDREMLMMPHKSRKQLYSSAVRRRHHASIKSVSRAEFVDHEKIMWLKNCLWSSSSQAVIVSRYDSNIAVLAIESLYMFAVQSYREDRYGMVLKDLPGIIGVMVKLIQTIDKFFRVRASQALPIYAEVNVKPIDSALQAGLLRINGTFGSHFGELNLTHEQLQTIKMWHRLPIVPGRASDDLRWLRISYGVSQEVRILGGLRKSLLSAFVIQWAMLLRGFLSKQFSATGTFTLGVPEMMCADNSCAVVLITMGVLLGRMTPVQFLLLAFLETSISVLVDHIVFNILHVNDGGRSLVVHAFGAYFGLAAALVGKKKNVMEMDEQGSIHHSDLFSMIEDARHRAIMNTYLAMASGTVTTFILSSFVDNLGRFNMIHIQSSTLSGGVAIGSAANAVLYPSHAVAVAFVRASFPLLVMPGLVSPKLEKRFKLFDTCGVHNLHGIPGILAGIFSIVFALGYEPESYGKTLYHIYPYFEGGPMQGDRNRETQALYQLAGMGTALASAVVGGLITGLILQIRVINQVDDPHMDHDDINYYAHSEFNFLSKYQHAQEQELMERERLHEIY
ncbi:hypothetical protein KIN20_034925 [Parelaphostrongylus tenuis]|uniref:Ammonium transporter AmtB-like domain-containing protein n=1 Tax=Parelaphostrongylus tenuis TaxID=148309 RepID=A0AAD5RAF1_PARTN|nr:hypothetical protein KIN20_034925 [Parelaphostrongylus tenuis]